MQPFESKTYNAMLLNTRHYTMKRPGDKSSVSMWLDTDPSNEQASHDPGLAVHRQQQT